MQLRAGAVKLKHNKEIYKDLSSSMEIDPDLHLSAVNVKEHQLNSMEECMKSLNNEQRLCVELFYLQEKSYNEVAEMTTFSMNNVKSYIQNGKRNLKICIESKVVSHQ
jgi:RNA polymerase sigma-70 factor (ECF subfamily)